MIHQLHQTQPHQKTQVIYFRISVQLLCAFLWLRHTSIERRGLVVGRWERMAGCLRGGRGGHCCFTRGRIALCGPGALKGSPISQKQSGSPAFQSSLVCFLEGPVVNFCFSFSLNIDQVVTFLRCVCSLLVRCLYFCNPGMTF